MAFEGQSISDKIGKKVLYTYELFKAHWFKLDILTAFKEYSIGSFIN